MTRFARAKGSKSSNEKKPEEATSWSEMKNSMLSKKINELKKSFPKTEPKIDIEKATEWASLGDDFGNSVSLMKQHLGKKKHIKINNADLGNSYESKIKKLKPIEGSEKEAKQDGANGDSLIKKKNKKQKCSVSEEVSTENNDSGIKKENKKRKLEASLDSEIVSPVKKKKISKDNQNLEVENLEKQKHENLANKRSKEFQKIKKTVKSKHLKNEDLSKNFKSELDGKKMFDKKLNRQLKNKKKLKNRKYEDRNLAVEELIINGEKIPIVKFQGFNVTLEDAERLKKLRREMVKEGIPKAKLEAAIKLERRRAEKALSRLKKSVCFHCRGHGHVLSNCPNLTEKENTSTGICYKCGSTEHSASECKVVRGANFQFAECFICKEQGHIAKQCPDNPRGLYPQGGACRECGDVTHLRKDCPLTQAQKAEEVVTVGVRNDRNLECLDEEVGNREKQNPKKKIKKSLIVKF